MTTIKANFFGNDITLSLTEEEVGAIVSMAGKEIGENAKDENFLGGFKNIIVKQITTYDELDNAYDDTLQDRDERPREFPFENFFDTELPVLLNNIQIVLLDDLGILGGESNKYLDMEEIHELREAIEIEIEMDEEAAEKLST